MSHDVPVIPDGNRIVGTCGVCGGPVTSPIVWCQSNIVDGPPQICAVCGAHAKKILHEEYGPTLEME